MKNKQLSLIIFLFIELYIYLMLLFSSKIMNSNILFFIGISLCFIMGLFMYCKSKDYYIMIISLFLSLISSLFASFFPNLIVINLVLLNIIQILYFLRIYLDSDYKRSNLLTRLVVIPIMIIASLVLKERTNINVFMWILFIVNLFINIIFTIKEIGINNLFPIGLLLLFIYGAFVMFYSLDSYVTTSLAFVDTLNNFTFDIRKIFYLPSLVVLTCSIFTVNRRLYSIKKDSNN